MNQYGRKAILALAATVSLASHWLLLRGLDAPWLAEQPVAASVMIAQLQAPPMSAAPVRPPPATARQTSEPAAAASTATNRPAETAPPGGESTPVADDANDKKPNPEQHAQSLGPAVQSGQQTFQVFLGDGDGDALAVVNHALRVNDGHYELSSRGEALGLLAMLYSGLLTQHSSGTLDAGGFSTQHYTEQRGKKPETRAEIDPFEPVVRFSHGGQTALASRRVYDRLSVMYELALMVRAQPDLQRTADLPVLSGQALETWRFVRVGTDDITTNGQRIAALHFRRQTADGGERTGIDIWLDVSGNGWPVQIRLTDRKGTVITQRRQ